LLDRGQILLVLGNMLVVMGVVMGPEWVRKEDWRGGNFFFLLNRWG
jgi:hypothetical protein